MTAISMMGARYDDAIRRKVTPSQHIWVITGPAGCGKSTVGERVAERMNLPFVEGDLFHAPANINKMTVGIPLTDDDRWDWLETLREEALNSLSLRNRHVIVSCSALKNKHRNVLRIAAYHSPNVHVHFVYLHVNRAIVRQRLKARHGHFMGPEMVESQFKALQVPRIDEKDVISIDASTSIDYVVDSVKRAVEVALVTCSADNLIESEIL